MTCHPGRKGGWLRALLAPLAAMAALLGAPAAHAQYAAMLAVDPSDRALSAVYGDISTGLARTLKLPVRVDRSTNFADVLRSTRTGEYDIYVVPVQVAASGMAHGYTILADSGEKESFVLVTPARIDTLARLKGARMYLPQQDSIYSYMAKGLLNEAGLSLRQLGNLQYQKTSGAGLVALEMGITDATVVRRSEYARWSAGRDGRFRTLLESQPVPSGLAVMVKKSMPAALQQAIAQWAATPGAGAMKPAPQLVAYQYVAGLGHFTPAQLPGVQMVRAEQAAELMKKGALMVDVRSAKEYGAKHIAGAVLAPYLEKSAKDTSFDAKQDDFTAIARLDKARPTIFACNGAECWKSYKASKAAAGLGFAAVYWLRGGLPEWDGKGMPVAVGD